MPRKASKHSRKGAVKSAPVATPASPETPVKVSTQPTSVVASETLPAQPVIEPKAAPAVETHRPSTILGDYVLLSRLGQGGMGAVYKAKQKSLDREVALKVLNRDLAAKPGFIDRFRKEARAMARLNHPNILQCYDINEARSYHYIAIEYMDGGSAEAWLRKLRKFTVGDSVHIILACAYALHYAHDEGLVHRDIKPDNILLTRTGLVKIADLGLVKDLDEDVSSTRPGVGAGTPLYIAPEQARSLRLADHRSDIYSLGCMLYVFLTGKYPFHGDNIVDIILAKRKGEYIPLREHDPSIPPVLEKIVAKMLAVKPEDRYQDCGQIIARLEAMKKSSRQLEFLTNAASIPRASGRVTQVRLPPFQQTITQMPAIPVAHPAAKPVSQPGDDQTWYWCMKTPEGQIVVKPLTGVQLRSLIETGMVSANSRISKSPRTGFRILGSFKELQPSLRQRRQATTNDDVPTTKAPTPTRWRMILVLLLTCVLSAAGVWWLLEWLTAY